MALFEWNKFGNVADYINHSFIFLELHPRLGIIAKDHRIANDHLSGIGSQIFSQQLQESSLPYPIGAHDAYAFSFFEFIKEIVGENKKIHSLSLPPIFGKRKRKAKKLRKKKKQNRKQRLKILYDTELRSKANSVLQSNPPTELGSNYKTSRLTLLLNEVPNSPKSRVLRSNLMLPSINSLHHSQRLIYDTSKFLKESTLILPNIYESSLTCVYDKGSGMLLEGNKKEIMRRHSKKGVDTVRKKELREIALGTDIMDFASDQTVFENELNEDTFYPSDQSNMRSSYFSSRT